MKTLNPAVARVLNRLHYPLDVSIRPRIPVVESAADFVETPVPLGRVFGGGADSCIRGGDIAHC
jgi:hypothetical protein